MTNDEGYFEYTWTFPEFPEGELAKVPFGFGFCG